MDDRALQLTARLGRFLRRWRALSVGRVLLLAGAGWLGFILVTMAIDCLSEMSTQTRWMLSRGSLIVSVGLVAAFVWRELCGISVGRLALRIDAQQNFGGEITTAWDLARHGNYTDDSLTTRFTLRAIARSEAKLAAIPFSAVFPLKSLQRASLCFGCLMLLPLLVGLVAPKLAWIQFQRFAFPSSDTPPFSGLVISLEQSDFQLLYGDDAKIVALVSRKPNERLELVTVSQSGKERSLPMLPRGEAKWQALVTQVQEPVTFYVRSDRTRSPTGKLEVQLTPQITECLVRITPPEYTHQAVYEGAVPKDGIAGLAGTKVDFAVTSNRPLANGNMHIEYEDRTDRDVPLGLSENDNKESSSVQGSFVLDLDAEFEIKVTDVDGIQSTGSVAGKFSILTDQRPVVRILEPRPLSLATADIDLPIVISAEDDFGLSQLRLYRNLNGSSSSFVDLEIDGSARSNVTKMLPLKRFGLSPGDEIHLFARTEDNDPNGPKGSESPKTVIRIISIAEFQERMLEQRGAEALSAKYEAAQRQLENISNAIAEMQEAAQRAENDPNNPAIQQELQQKMQAVQDAAKNAAEAIEKLAENPMDIDVDRELAEMLQEMAKDASEIAEAMGEIAEKQAGQRPLNETEQSAVQQMREKIQGMREEIQEEAIDPLNELSKTMALMDAKERFDDLVEQQQELAQRMKSLAESDPTDPSNERRMMEMEAAQEELKQQLMEVAESLEASAEELPANEEFSELAQQAKELAQGIKQSGAPELMGDAQKSLLKSKFDQAAENAAAAAEALASLLPNNESMGQQADENAKDAFNKPGKNGKAGKSKLGNSLEQLKQRMNRNRAKGQQPGQGEAGQEQSGMPGGPNNGYSQRSPRSQNTGMYGSMPSQSPSSRGRSDKVSQGGATRSEISRQNSGVDRANATQSTDASGQSQQNVPNQYRQKVSEFYRRIQEQLSNPNH